MKMNFTSSNFTDEMQSDYDSSHADVLPPSSSKEEKTEKTRKHQREDHRKYYKEKQQQLYMCRICGKTLSDISTSLIPKDMKSLKDVQKQKPMFGEISSY